MKKLLVVSAFIFPACAVEVGPADDGQSPVTNASDTPVVSSDDGVIPVGFTYGPESCSDHSVYFEPHNLAAVSATPQCLYEFEDGSTETTCFAVHSVPGDPESRPHRN